MEALRSPRGVLGKFNQAVSRSDEFLSCAKTSWKIRQQEIMRQQQRQAGDGNPPPPPPRNPKFVLASSSGSPPASLVILEDGLTLLRAMEYGTKKLQGLVRRRGHTNDPTEEIGSIVKQLEQDLKELTSYCEQLLTVRRRKQQQRHWEFVVQWFHQVANHHSEQLQECLKLRGEILADQAQTRRKLVERNGGNKNKPKGTSSISTPLASSGSATPLFNSPLFTAAPPIRNKKAPTKREDMNGVSKQLNPTPRRVQPATSTGASNYYQTKSSAANGARTGATGAAYGGAYGGGYGGNTSTGYAGYGGGGYGGSGMRQRRGNNTASSTVPVQEQEEEEKIHSQIQIRERKRQTQQRLDEARQAESTLSEVAKLYSKMSTLITQQGETLDSIEDDVECALVDVSAGQEELTILYSIKKGNRPLILKTYAILIFLIVFMRGYRDR